MEKVGKIIRNILIGIWFVIAIFVTACLLSYNDFKVSTFGKTSLLIIDNDEMEPEFNEGDLLVIKRNSDAKINVGDQVFYYNSAMNTSTLVFLGDVEEKQAVSKTDSTFTIEGSKVSGEYVIGSTDNAKVYHNAGKFLGVITSRWGFMFFILFPMLFAIIYEIMMIVDSAKKDKKEEE